MCQNIVMCAGMFACQACSDCMGSSFKQQVRAAYFFFDGIFVAFCLLILYGLSDLLSQTGWMITILQNYIQCPNGDPLSTCLGISAIFRISLALVAMHVMILFFLIMRNGCSKVFNEEIWMFKLLVILALTIGFFFVSNDVFVTYSTVALIISIFFLLFQIVMIIDLFYLWGVEWVRKYDQGYNCYMYLLIITTVVLYAGTIYFIVDSYVSFGGCGAGTLATTIGVVFTIIGAVLIFLGTNPDGSLLTSSAVSLFNTYLIWSGLSNMPDECNALQNEDSTTIINIVLGLIIIITSLTYVSVGSSEATSGQIAPAGVNLPQAVLASPEDEDEKDDKKRRLDEEARPRHDPVTEGLKPYQSNSYIKFHIIMIFACCYVSMLLTNWGSPVVGGNHFVEFSKGAASEWIKIGTSWATMVIYIWTLVAPRVCPDRDFS